MVQKINKSLIERKKLGIFFGLGSDLLVIFEVVFKEGMFIELLLVIEVVHVGVLEGIILVESGRLDSVSAHLEPSLPHPGIIFQDLGVKMQGEDKIVLGFQELIRGAEVFREVFEFGG